MSMSPTVMAATISATLHLSQEALAMQRARNHYEGHPPLPLRLEPGSPSDAVLVSPLRALIDTNVSFLFGKPVQSQVTGSGAQQKQDWLDEAYRRAKRQLILQLGATEGALTGAAAWRILPAKPWPRILALSVQYLTVETAPDDVTEAWRYIYAPPPIQREDQDEPEAHRTVVTSANAEAGYRTGTESWAILDQVRRGGSWVTVAQEAFPYAWCPLVTCQNTARTGSWYGYPDATPEILGVCEALNKVASHWNKIIRIHASPKVWGRGMGPRAIDTASSNIIFLPSETAELRILEMQSDLNGTARLYSELLQMLAMMSRTPLCALGLPDSQGALSGVSMALRYQPMIDRLEGRRLVYGDAITELDRRLLDIGGWGDQNVTELVWGDPMPHDSLSERQVLELDLSMGLCSKRTAAEAAGYDFDHEADLIAEEKAAEPPPVLPPLPGTNGAVPPPQPLQGPVPEVAKGQSYH